MEDLHFPLAKQLPCNRDREGWNTGRLAKGRGGGAGNKKHPSLFIKCCYLKVKEVLNCFLNWKECS